MLNARMLTLMGRSFYGLALVGSGVQQLITHQFVRLVPKPPSVPPTVWPMIFGVFLVLSGLMILVRRGERQAGIAVATVLLLSLLFQHVPIILAAPQLGYVWTNPCKVLALLGGALVVTLSLRESDANDGGGSLFAGGPVVAMSLLALSIFLLVCGVQHFVYADFVVTLVPSWVGNARFWTYFTGSALLAGGAGLLVPRTARCAALLSGLMVFLWVVLLHIPRAIMDANHAGEAAGIFEALAISGTALALAGRLRRKASG